MGWNAFRSCLGAKAPLLESLDAALKRRSTVSGWGGCGVDLSCWAYVAAGIGPTAADRECPLYIFWQRLKAH